MADQRISALTPIVGADLADDDLFVVVDTSTSSTKHVRRDELIKVLTASPGTGQVVYYNGTTFTGLAIGSAGQVLTVNSGGTLPEWAALPAAGMEFLASADASSDATVDFTAFDNASYDAYIFALANVVPASDNVRFYMRTSSDGGTSYSSGGSDYEYSIMSVNQAGSVSGNGSTSDTKIDLHGTTNIGSSSGEDGVCGHIFVAGAGLAKRTRFNFNLSMVGVSGNVHSATGSGERRAQEDVTGVRFFMSSGNIESGTITMYGMRNS